MTLFVFIITSGKKNVPMISYNELCIIIIIII